MRLIQLLEAINQTLYYDSVDALDSVVDEQSKKWITQIKRMLDFDSYRTAERQAYDDDDYDRAGKLRDDWYQKFYDFMNEAEKGENGVYDGLLKNFKNALELKLQGVARDYIESKLGKIVGDKDHDDFEKRRKNHLYWMQHIIVDIGLDDANPHNQGGHYQRHAGPDTYKTDYTAANFDRQNDLGVAVKLFTTKKLFWDVIEHAIKGTVQEEIFGEPMTEGDPRHELNKAMMPTFVHEVVHMEQDAREHRDPDKPWHRRAGITYTPDPTKPRQKTPDQSGTHTGGKTDKWGRAIVRRGKRDPDYINRPKYTENEFMSYLGSAHEIEAHAAGAAAKLFAGHWNAIKNSRFRTDPRQKQAYVNEAIDSILEDLRTDQLHYLTGGGSLVSYARYIRRMVDDQMQKLPQDETLPKVNILYRKAWTIFMKKLVKHLLAFKKPLPDEVDPWADPVPEPKRKSALAKPERQPELP